MDSRCVRYPIRNGQWLINHFACAVIAAAFSLLPSPPSPPEGEANGPCSILVERNNAKSSFITISSDKDNEL